MKITYFRGENLAGLKIGTGKDIVEIDFSKNKNPIALLLGGNGKGKTALLSVLHPLRGTNDNRSVVFDGEKGYKEIHIVEGNDLYIVRHTWKPNKAFISKNGQELNENGNITTFNKIVEQELGVTEDYFKVGRLGNNITNFINLKSSDRKKYISNFLPNIDEYLKLFDIAKSKYSMMNKELNNIGTQLGKFPEYSILEEKVSTLKEQLENINETISDIEKKQAVKEFEINNLLKHFENVGIDINDRRYTNSLSSDIRLAENKLSNDIKIINDYIAKYPNLASYDDNKIESSIEDLTKKINELEKVYVSLESEYNNIKQNSTDTFKRLSVMRSRIDEDVTGQLIDIREKIKFEENRYTSLEANLKDVDERLFDYYITDFNKIKLQASKLLDRIVNNLITQYNFANYNFAEINSAESLEECLMKLEDELSELDNFITYTNNNKQTLEILDKRPNDCAINTCPFITNSLRFKEEYYDNLSKVEERREEVIVEINKINKQLEYIGEMIKFAEEAQKVMYDYHKLQSSFIEDYFDEELEGLNDMVRYLSNGVSYIEKSLNVDEIYDAINTKKELEISKNLLNSYKENEVILLDKEANVNALKEEILELEETYKIYEQQQMEIEQKISSNNKSINVSKAKMNILSTLKDKRGIISSAEIEIKEKQEFLNKILQASDEYTKLFNEYSSFNEMLNNNKKIKASLEKECAKDEKDLNYIQILLDKKEELDEKFEYTKLIKNALDPKQGIPLLYIDDFLQSITEKTNKLLSIAYDDRFKISFDITEKDFFIRVHRLFSELEDINQASQGETSMTTLSLSLSMIENMVKKYNILYLDEIDATLSTENRRLFLTMLEKQLIDLGIEQVFIISHNNEFYSYPVDLILFHENDVDKNDKEFMTNKNIIFDINEV